MRPITHSIPTLIVHMLTYMTVPTIQYMVGGGGGSQCSTIEKMGQIMYNTYLIVADFLLKIWECHHHHVIFSLMSLDRLGVEKQSHLPQYHQSSHTNGHKTAGVIYIRSQLLTEIGVILLEG